jgi:hypothetical protein
MRHPRLLDEPPVGGRPLGQSLGVKPDVGRHVDIPARERLRQVEELPLGVERARAPGDLIIVQVLHYGICGGLGLPGEIWFHGTNSCSWRNRMPSVA